MHKEAKKVSHLINIALLGNFTTDYIGYSLKEECTKHNINAAIYNAPYNQYNQEILNTSSGYYTFGPDLTIVLLEGKILFPDWYKFEFQQNQEDSKITFIQNVFQVIISFIENIHANSHSSVVLNNFKLPYFSPLGILDNKQHLGLKKMINLLNNKLEEWALNKDYLYISDYNGLCAQYGNNKAEDDKMYYLAKSCHSVAFTEYMSREYLRYILPMLSLNRKCLVLDLDNTLWGGIAGEDGISGIKLDITGTGRCFYDFQQEILNLYHKGILLAVNSKNNYDDAISIIENHPYMLLRKEYFSNIKINWQNKAANLENIARELNIGIDSLVFFDDNPVEREFVKSVLPEVKVIEVPADTSKYAQSLREEINFELLKITDEDRKRNEMYEANKQRYEVQKRCNDLEEYLAVLDTKLVIEGINEFTKSRVVQLLQKTNQFNMTTIRYDINDLDDMIKSDNHLILTCSVTDKFGDNGIVGTCIIKTEGPAAYINSFLLSCRVLGRNIEYAFLGTVVDLLKSKGIELINAKYIKTQKNTAYSDFYNNAGLLKESTDDNETCFLINNKSILKKVDNIKVIVKDVV